MLATASESNEAIESRVQAILGEIRGAQSPGDLDGVLDSVIMGGLLEGFLGAVLAAVPCSDEQLNLVADDIAAALDPELQAAVRCSMLASQVALANPTLGVEHVPSLQEQLCGDGLPAVQEAIYAGSVALISLLALLDNEPLPAWLGEELRRRLASSQPQHQALVVAWARAAGVMLPEPLQSIAPLDLDQARQEADWERRAVNSYLDGLRASRGTT